MDDRRRQHRCRFRLFFEFLYNGLPRMLAPYAPATAEPKRDTAVKTLAELRALVAKYQASSDPTERARLRAEGETLERELVRAGVVRLHEFQRTILVAIREQEAAGEFTTDRAILEQFGYSSWDGSFRRLENLRLVRRVTVRGCGSAVVRLTADGNEILERIELGGLQTQ